MKVGDVVKFKCKSYNICGNSNKRDACNCGIVSRIIVLSDLNRKSITKDHDDTNNKLDNVECYFFVDEIEKATQREEFLYLINGPYFLEDECGDG